MIYPKLGAVSVSVSVALAVFAALLIFGVLTQDAQAWVAAFSEGMTANAPMGPEGLIAFVSIITTAISAVWLYLTQVVR